MFQALLGYNMSLFKFILLVSKKNIAASVVRKKKSTGLLMQLRTAPAQMDK